MYYIKSGRNCKEKKATFQAAGEMLAYFDLTCYIETAERRGERIFPPKRRRLHKARAP